MFLNQIWRIFAFIWKLIHSVIRPRHAKDIKIVTAFTFLALTLRALLTC